MRMMMLENIWRVMGKIGTSTLLQCLKHCNFISFKICYISIVVFATA